MKLLIATGNPGKVREFAGLLAPLGWNCTALKDLAPIEEPEETGSTFLANACLKATHYAKAAGLITLADDSGLEVDALGNAPGVLSARWAAHHGEVPEDNPRAAKDAANNALLLRQLSRAADDQRTARFVCVLAVANPQGQILYTARGTLEGVIGDRPEGANGFGYDPLFRLPALNKTTAQLTSEEKHLLSHRGQALRRLVDRMAGGPSLDRL